MLRILAASLLFPGAATSAVPSCAGADLRAASPGYTCATKAGHSFRLERRTPGGKELWTDTTSGLLWSDVLTERVRRAAAAALCRVAAEENAFPQHHASRVPTLAEFEAAEKHGFREVLPRMMAHFFWADSTVPGAANVGHVFNGVQGKAELVVYRSINFEEVRCVGK